MIQVEVVPAEGGVPARLWLHSITPPSPPGTRIWGRWDGKWPEPVGTRWGSYHVEAYRDKVCGWVADDWRGDHNWRRYRRSQRLACWSQPLTDAVFVDVHRHAPFLVLKWFDPTALLFVQHARGTGTDAQGRKLFWWKV